MTVAACSQGAAGGCHDPRGPSGPDDPARRQRLVRGGHVRQLAARLPGAALGRHAPLAAGRGGAGAAAALGRGRLLGARAGAPRRPRARLLRRPRREREALCGGGLVGSAARPLPRRGTAPVQRGRRDRPAAGDRRARCELARLEAGREQPRPAHADPRRAARTRGACAGGSAARAVPRRCPVGARAGGGPGAAAPRRHVLSPLLGRALLRPAVQLRDRRGALALAAGAMGEAARPVPRGRRLAALPGPRERGGRSGGRTAAGLPRLRAQRLGEPAARDRAARLRRRGLAGRRRRAREHSCDARELRLRERAARTGLAVAGGAAPRGSCGRRRVGARPRRAGTSGRHRYVRRAHGRDEQAPGCAPRPGADGFGRERRRSGAARARSARLARGRRSARGARPRRGRARRAG